MRLKVLLLSLVLLLQGSFLFSQSNSKDYFRLAVGNFFNQSTEVDATNTDWFGHGMQYELIKQLTPISAFVTIGQDRYWQSFNQALREVKDPYTAQIDTANMLGVDYYIYGEYTIHLDKLSIKAHLKNNRDSKEYEYVLQAFDYDVNQVFEIATEIRKQTVDYVNQELGASKQIEVKDKELSLIEPQPTRSVDAFKYFSQSHSRLYVKDIRSTVKLLYKALQRDENYVDVLRRIASIYDAIGENYLALKAYNRLAIIFHHRNNLDQALNYYSKCVAIALKFSYHQHVAIYYQNLGAIYQKLGNYEEAEGLFARAQEMFQYFDATTELAQTIFDRGVLAFDKGNIELAFDYFNASLALAKKDKNMSKANLSQLYGALGYCYYYLNMFDKAVEAYSYSLAYSEEIEDNDSISYRLYDVGVLYNEMGVGMLAKEYIERAIPFFEREKKYQALRQCYSTLGSVYENMKDWQKAIDSYNKAKEMDKIVPERDRPLEVYHDEKLGFLHSKIEDYDTSLEFYQKSLKEGGNHVDKAFIASELLNTGVLLMEKDASAQSIKFIDEALPVFKELKDSTAVANCYYNIGLNYELSGDASTAFTWYTKVLDIEDKNSILPEHYYAIGDHYYKRGDQANAYIYLEKALDVADKEYHHELIKVIAHHINDFGINEWKKGTPEARTKAKAYFDESLKIAQNIESPELEVLLCNNIAYTYESDGLYKEALPLHERSLVLLKDIGDGYRVAKKHVEVGYVLQKMKEYRKAYDAVKFGVDLEFQLEHPDWEKDNKYLQELGEYIDYRYFMEYGELPKKN